jgi:hypothetical protein
MSYNGPNHKRLKFESLENRVMLAGNVVSSINNGFLNLCGDAKGDQFLVRQLDSGDWCVSGINKTKIDGLKSETFSNVCSLSIKTLGGNDVVAVADGCLPGPLCIDTGAGCDIVALVALQVGSVNVSTGAGNDALIVAGLKTQSPSTTNAITPLTTQSQSSSVCFDMGNGTNIVLLVGIQTDSLSLRTGAGNDYVGLAGVCVDNCLSVDTGTGIDLLGVIDSSASFAKFSGGSQPGDLLATGQNSFGGTSSDFKVTLNLDPLVKDLNAQLKSVQKTLLSTMNLNQLSSLKF